MYVKNVNNMNSTRSEFYRLKNPEGPRTTYELQQVFEDMFKNAVREADGMEWTRKLSKPPYGKT